MKQRPIEKYGWERKVLDDGIMFIKNDNLFLHISHKGIISISTSETYPSEKITPRELEEIYIMVKERVEE